MMTRPSIERPIESVLGHGLMSFLYRMADQPGSIVLCAANYSLMSPWRLSPNCQPSSRHGMGSKQGASETCKLLPG